MSTDTTTRSVRDVVVHLRAIADMIWSLHTDEELAAPVEVGVYLTAAYGADVDDAAKMAMVDQVAAFTGEAAAAMDNTGGKYGSYTATLRGDGEPWRLVANAYVRRPDPDAALHAELEQLRAKVAAFEAQAEPAAVAEDEIEAYAQSELDQDRIPTVQGLAASKARRTVAARVG